MNHPINKSMIKVVAGERAEGERLDKFLSEDSRLGSRAVAQGLIEQGVVFVNSEIRSKSYKVSVGDIIEFSLPEPKKIDIKPQEVEFKIVYEDEFLAVISKPAGLVVHPAHSYDEATLVHGLLAHFETLSEADGERPGIVHRLDKDTSGLMIIAKQGDAHRALSEALKQREVSRQYLSLVLGDIKDNGTVDAAIGRSQVNRKRMAVTASGKIAKTDFDVLRRFGEATFISLKLFSGRTHQIRVHMSYIGHPVVGDNMYGGMGKISSWLGLDRQFLHSARLAFKHPMTGEDLDFEEPLPGELQNALDILEKRLVAKT